MGRPKYLVFYLLGGLAAVMGDQGGAAAHFEVAITSEESFGARPRRCWL